MANKLYEESSIQAIANAIRSRTGGSDTYLISEMAEAVSDLPNQYGSSDEGKAVHNGALSSQTQMATQITENGTYDTTFNSSVEVNVTPGEYSQADEGKVIHNGELSFQTQRTIQITENGTYDTTFNNSIEVNIETIVLSSYGKAITSIPSGVSDLACPIITVMGVA